MPLAGLNSIMSAAMRGARADFALIGLLVDPERLLIHSGIGTIAEEMIGNLTAITGSRAEPVLREGRAVLVADYVRDGGAEPEIRPRIGSVIMVPLRIESRVEGTLSLGRESGREPFTDTELNDVASFVDRAETSRELDTAREERRSARLLEDRTRIAADLHDHVIQELFAAGMTLQSIAVGMPDDAVRARILDQVTALDSTVARIRTMISELPRNGSDEQPLTKRLVAIVDSLTPALKTLPTVSIVGPVEASVRPELALDLEAVLREALSNVARHARATEVRVRVTVADDELSLDVIDDGLGIDGPTRSSGLANMRFRADVHGGELRLDRPPDGGTHLHWTALLSARG